MDPEPMVAPKVDNKSGFLLTLYGWDEIATKWSEMLDDSA